MTLVIVGYDIFGQPITEEREEVKNMSENEIKDISDKIKTQYIIEVICDDEKHQERLFNELTKGGKTCRVLTL